MPYPLKLTWAAAALALWTVSGLSGCATPPPQQTEEDTGPIVFPKPPDPPRFVFERTLVGTGAVRSLTETDRFRTLLTGAATREGIGFAKPFDLAVHQGRVYVTDTVQRTVLAMDFPNQRWFVIGDQDGEGTLSKPLGIAIDAQGEVYVSDITQRRVKVYDAAGRHLRSIDVSAFARRPSGLDVTPAGDRLFIIDTGGIDTDQHSVFVVDARTGQLIRTIGTRGTGDGEMNLPRDVKLGKNGLLYVTDGGNFRVQVFTQEGEFVRKWGSPGRQIGQFTRPKGIAADPDGNIYVVDAAFGNFQIFTAEGQLLMFIGGRSTTPGPAQYMLPSGIDVDEDGRIYFIDQFFSKIDVFRPVGIKETDGWLGRAPAPQ